MTVDKYGREILQGDLLRSFHFRGRNRKNHYLYHVAMIRDGCLMLVPVSEAAGLKHNGGVVPATCKQVACQMEIISGGGPDGERWWYDRPKTNPKENQK